mgnify:CR=1 FL=1
MQYPWGHNRRFNAYANYFKEQFGERIQKLSIDAGFTCPNRDGAKGVGGCTFCNNKAFNPSYCVPTKSVTQQLNEGIENEYQNDIKIIVYLFKNGLFWDEYTYIFDIKSNFKFKFICYWRYICSIFLCSIIF